jgi:hypothetical protein
MVFSMHDPADLDVMLRDGGFADVRSTVYTATLDLPSPAEFLWQYINLTPMAQVVETWQPQVRDGRTPVEQPMVLATGVRS